MEVTTKTHGNASRQSLPPQIDCYFPRRLRKPHINSRILEIKAASDILIFTETSRSHLVASVKHSDTTTNWLQAKPKEKKSRFLVLEDIRHFEQICYKVKVPVHLLEARKDGNFSWLRSKGNLTLIREHFAEVPEDIEVTPVKLASEREILAANHLNLQKHICISDGPGTGKSTLLSNLARQLAKARPDLQVIFLSFSELLQAVIQSSNEKEKTPTSNDAKAQRPKTLEYVKLLLKRFPEFNTINSFETHPVHFCLDGFDQTGSDTGLALSIIKSLITHFPKSRIWVTTQPQRQLELENLLETVSYKIEPFTEKEEISLITSLWTSTGRIPSDNPKRLESHAKTCLDSHKIMLSDLERDMAGTPLRCFMLAKISEGQVAADVRDSVDQCDLGFVDLNWLCELYEEFVHVHLLNFYQRFGTSDTPGVVEVILVHRRLALEQLYPGLMSKCNIYPKSHLEGTTVTNETLYEVGIIRPSYHPTENNYICPIFIHQTFAEYFASLHMSAMLDPKSDHMSTCFVRNGLLRIFEPYKGFEFPEKGRFSKFFGKISTDITATPVCYFLNAILQNEEELISANLSCDEAAVDKALLKDAFCMSLVIGCRNIVNLLYITYHRLIDAEFSVEEWTKVIRVCIQYSEADALGLLLDILEGSKCGEKVLYPNFRYECVCDAATRGMYSFFEYIFFRFETIEYIFKKSPDWKQSYARLISSCIKLSSKDEDGLLKDKMRILDFLGHILVDGYILSECLEEIWERLEFVHPKLLMYILIPLSDIPQFVTETIFTKIESYWGRINADDFHSFVVFLNCHKILREAVRSHRKRSPYKDSVLHVAVREVQDLRGDTIRLLRVSSKADFKAVNSSGDCALDVARQCNSVRVVEDLKALGAVKASSVRKRIRKSFKMK